MEADTDRDGKISFEEFTKMVENTDVSMSMTLGTPPRFAVHALDLFSCLYPLSIPTPKHRVPSLTLSQISSSRYPDSDS